MMRLLCLIGAVLWGLVAADFLVGFLVERTQIRLVFLLASYGGCVACLQRGYYLRPGPVLDALILAGVAAGALCVLLLAYKLATRGMGAFRKGGGL